MEAGHERTDERTDAHRRRPPSRLTGHQGQVGNGGGEEELEERLAATEVARLADAQLNQSRDAVLDHLALPAEVIERRNPLPGSGSLDLRLLWVETHVPSVRGDLPLEALRA